MKHLKTYKLFKENVYDADFYDLSTEIKEILLPLTDKYLKIEVTPIYETDETYFKIVITDAENSFHDFSAKEFGDEFKHLFSFMKNDDWIPMSKDDSIINNTGTNLQMKSIASHVELSNDEFFCPECGSDKTTELDADNEKCDTCEYEGHPDDFVLNKIKFGTIEELLSLIDRKLDKIQICFIKNKN